ncbi:MAG TPA: patatin-like phospholipase family protein [Anaeromyxobacteraceae bacterium]|nr:patatin-like phospholipase family protein [Anaeromyxobacteraceae bacterium]
MEHTGLVLTGGGARAAYQVGALRALAEIVGPGPLPFDILAGISAGGINTIALGTGAEDFRGSVEGLRDVWAGLTPDSIYRTGAFKLASIGSRWIRDLSAGGLVGKSGINYLLDSAPLRNLIAERVPIGRVRRHLRSGRLRGVALSVTDYLTGAGVTFFEGAADIEPWTRSTRIGVRARLTLEHVMASSAIPVFFPPVKIGGAWYGDGCVRMIYPMSPAIHMGAQRIVAISVRHLRPPAETAARESGASQGNHPDALPVSEIAGVLLNAVFLDSLDSDVERLERINRTVALIPRERLGRSDVDLRPVPVLVLRPSEDLGRLAADEYQRFPRMLRYLLKGIGATGHAGEDLLSYLAFEPVYVTRVMDLGYSDTMARRADVEAFFLGEPARLVPERTRARV